MNTDEHGFNLRAGRDTYEIVGAAIAVLNVVGHGLHEKPYENALTIELRDRGVPFAQQQKFSLTYKGALIGEFVPDLLVGDDVVVDTKVIDSIGDHKRGQMLNYLKITRRSVGLILNFKRAKLEWERIVL